MLSVIILVSYMVYTFLPSYMCHVSCMVYKFSKITHRTDRQTNEHSSFANSFGRGYGIIHLIATPKFELNPTCKL